jgi:hypothetical protein
MIQDHFSKSGEHTYFMVSDSEAPYYGRTGEYLSTRCGRVSLRLQTEDNSGKKTQSVFSFDPSQIQQV